MWSVLEKSVSLVLQGTVEHYLHQGGSPTLKPGVRLLYLMLLKVTSLEPFGIISFPSKEASESNFSKKLTHVRPWHPRFIVAS